MGINAVKNRCTVVFGGLCTIGTGHRADFVRSGHNAAPMLHTRFPVERQGKQCLNSPPRSRHLRTDSPALPPRHAISFLLHHTLAYMTPRTPASESHPSRPPFPLGLRGTFLQMGNLQGTLIQMGNLQGTLIRGDGLSRCLGGITSQTALQTTPAFAFAYQGPPLFLVAVSCKHEVCIALQTTPAFHVLANVWGPVPPLCRPPRL